MPPRLGGAVEKAWFALGRAFAARGHHVTHISRQFDDLLLSEQDGGVEYRRIPGYATPSSSLRLKACDFFYTWKARRALPAADIHVTNTFWMPFLERRPGKGRSYVHVARFPKGQLRLYPKRCVLQTVSAPIQKEIMAETGADSARVPVVPYPLSQTYLTGLLPAVSPRLLYTGRIHREKGLHLLVAAVVRLRQQTGFDWPVQIVGPWTVAQGGSGPEYLAELKAAAQAGSIAITFHEPIFDEQKLAALYRESPLFVYPSLADRGETFGLAALEAMGGGAVPIVSNLPCFRDFIQPGVNGLVFDHHAADPVAALATVLLDATRLRAEQLLALRQAAWKTARHYAIDQVADLYLADFYRCLTLR